MKKQKNKYSIKNYLQRALESEYGFAAKLSVLMLDNKAV